MDTLKLVRGLQRQIELAEHFGFPYVYTKIDLSEAKEIVKCFEKPLKHKVATLLPVE